MANITKVKDVMDLVTHEPAIVREDEPLPKVLKEMVKDPKTQTVYVVNDKEQLVGIITLNMALQYLFNEYIPPEYLEFNISVIEGTKATAKELMLPPLYVKKDDDVSEAFVKMFKYHIHEIPVVDEDMHIIGDVHGLELIEKWLNKNKE